MRLNPDCIRDILLYVEENINKQNNRIMVTNLISFLKPKYDEYTVNYHIIQLNDTGLFKRVVIADDNIPILITDLSYEGHTYINNIRDNKIWDKIKTLTKGVSSLSMPILIEYAKTVAMSFLPKP